jgi:fermentation-respiration switch protein FrsA (DUF1100 family)
MIVHKNIILSGSKDKPILLDFYYKRTGKPKPIIIFSHGFKGFKDWGHFELLAQAFADAGFIFVKFNFSYNGTTPKQPFDFADLEAFGNNNYSIELDDLGCVIDYVLKKQPYILNKEFDFSKLYLLGHSRGGGISILKSAEDKRITKLITWASVSQFGQFLPADNIEEWKNNGVIHTFNSRTKQNMPLYFQLMEDLVENAERLDITKKLPTIQCPFLIIHGSNDTTVPMDMALQLKEKSVSGELKIIENADHTFGGKHPWVDEYLPSFTHEAIKASVAFLKAP